MVGLLLDALGKANGMRILEIGTGCGYQAAVLAEAGWNVWSVEIRPELAQAARARLDSLGYGRIRTRLSNGAFGWPEESPFDVILLTAAPEAIPSVLLNQLAPSGSLVAPVGPEGEIQTLFRVTRGKSGDWVSEDLGGCRFVPMAGLGK